MAEPAPLPLRCAIRFVAGSRESLLDNWQQDIDTARVNLRTNAQVTSIAGCQGNFQISLASGEFISAESVVLAIGLQGNIRRLEVPGADLPHVQYQLDDPEDYAGETILVIGGGDAGVENALALAVRNQVTLINRHEEFTSCCEANFKRLREATAAGLIKTAVSTTATRIESLPAGDYPLALVVQSPQGEEYLRCHRVIARLGATPPRTMLEEFGIRFGSDDPAAAPQLSERYESSVPGLYVVGALAGYPLIKQALNQGYDVIDFILGNPVEPADQALLFSKLSAIPNLASVDDGISLLRRALPLFAPLTTLQMRDFMLESEARIYQRGEVIFERNDYSNSFYSLLQGSVQIHVTKDDGSTATFILGPGDFFGELGLLSGRRRSGTVVAGDGCVVVETPRRSMLKLLDATPGVHQRLDEVALKRIVRSCCGPSLTDDQLGELVKGARLKTYSLGDVIFREGDAADALYLIRRGSVTVSRHNGRAESILAYISAGHYFGEIALVSNIPRTATVSASAPTELVVLDATRFTTMLEQNPGVRGNVSGRYLELIGANASSKNSRDSEMIKFLMDQGIGEATNILMIDYARCIRCNNCERACAEVHDGTSRLSLKAGRTYQQLHVPASCRHCENPHCMKDCPADAIHRSAHGEVFISDSCIGCGNCQNNCPYGVIQMTQPYEIPQPSLWQMIAGIKPQPVLIEDGAGNDSKRAVKCDMCRGIVGGAACVRSCPTGAAFRVSPEDLLQMSGR